jgi:hypothetical protein
MLDYMKQLTGLQNQLKGLVALLERSSISRHEIIYQVNRIHEDIEKVKEALVEEER